MSRPGAGARHRQVAAAGLLGAAVLAAAASAPADVVTRCGWYDNPTPGNATLVDRDGEWIIGQQGAHQAQGPWPRFSRDRWVRTGSGSAGYGCACLKVEADAATHEVKRILSARDLPLATCRKDKALTGQEPENPMK